MAMWLHREMDFIQWSKASLWSLLQARGRKLTQKFLSFALEEGVLHLMPLTTLKTGPGEEGEHVKLLPNNCFGKC